MRSTSKSLVAWARTRATAARRRTPPSRGGCSFGSLMRTPPFAPRREPRFTERSTRIARTAYLCRRAGRADLKLARVPGYSSIVVPTVLIANASGNWPAILWTARQPVQCAGTSSSGDNSASASMLGSMIGSNIGPLRWNPPMIAATRSSPVSLCAYRTVLTMPACPQPLRTSRPRSRTRNTSAWSSRINGSGCQWSPCSASCPLKPVSNSVLRSTSPVTSAAPSSKNEGWRSSMI